MTPANVRAQIEAERAWRADEMRMLRNVLGTFASEYERAAYRKTLVVMLYAHFEGFCRNALSMFVVAVNSHRLTVAEANWSLAASSLSDAFARLADRDLKNKVFQRKLPDDTKLHALSRQRDFLESISDFEKRLMSLDPDSVVDAESNLNPDVVRKLLFRLGLDHELVNPWEGRLHMLLGRRNNIAHGASRAGIDSTSYATYEAAAGAIMDALTEAIYRELVDEGFRRPLAKPSGSFHVGSGAD